MTHKPPTKVLGRTIELSDGRLVFFGAADTEPNTFFFGFRNAKGDDHKFTLSREAKDALATLLKDPMAGMPLKDFPHKMVWKHIEFADEKSDGTQRK